MAAVVNTLPCPRCGQQSYTFVEGVRTAAPAQTPPIQTPTGYVLAQRARCEAPILCSADGRMFAITNGQQFTMAEAGQPCPPGWKLVPSDGRQIPPGMAAVACGQLVDLPMSSRSIQVTCPCPCRHTFQHGGEWIATTPAQVSGAQAPSIKLGTQVETEKGAGAMGRIAQSLGLGRPI